MLISISTELLIKIVITQIPTYDPLLGKYPRLVTALITTTRNFFDSYVQLSKHYFYILHFLRFEKQILT